MNRILFVDCCPRGSQSRTRALALEYLSRLEGECEFVLDTVEPYALGLTPLTPEELEARDMPGAADGKLADLARQFAAEDEIVIAAPYYNLAFPAALMAYLERISMLGVTFSMDKAESTGLCRASSLVYITTAGGFIGDRDMGGAYLRALANMLGIDDFVSIAAEGLDIAGMDVNERMALAKTHIARLFE